MKEAKENLEEDINNYFLLKAKEDIEHYYSNLEVRTVIAYTTCTVHITKMYEGLGNIICFQNLKWLSNLLNTDSIDFRNDSYTAGCDTCDHGSRQSVDIVCRNIKI